ncbi:MAG: hypothetical protein AB7R89_19185 [Dehalococcoidia bacterium]
MSKVANAGVEEAVTRNCQALLTGNIAQIFADMTPEAMAKIAQLGGGAMTGTMPALTSYDVISRVQDGEDHLYDVQFHGTPSFGVKARWREIGGLWKLVDFDGYQIDGSGDAGQAAAGPPA